MAAEIHLFVQFVCNIVTNSVVLFGGPILTLIGIGERVVRKEVHWKLYIGLLLGLVMCSFYISWRDMRVSLDAKPQSSQEIIVNEKDPQARADLIKATKRIQMLEGQLIEAQQEAKTVRGIATEAQLANLPKPLKQRLRECIDSIDPSITEGLLTEPKVIFDGEVDVHKLEELKQIASEPGASKYISVVVTSERLGGVTIPGTAVAGTKGVRITVNSELMHW